MIINNKILFRFMILALLSGWISAASFAQELKFINPENKNIRYSGRIDFSEKALPKYWQPGVYFTTRFKGNYTEVLLNDENRWNKNYNYVQIVVDGKSYRQQLSRKTDTIRISVPGKGWHNLTICKDTEAQVGYMKFSGLRARKIKKSKNPPFRKIEFFGNSITCGMGADESLIKCDEGEWYEQHNAWMSYAGHSARAFNAEFHLSSVSGIGLMHSCCGMEITIPQVYDKISMYDNQCFWDFNRYQPDLVVIALGQNDGIQPNDEFVKNYAEFVQKLSGHYPEANFLLISSPMANDDLRKFMSEALREIVGTLQGKIRNKADYYIFRERFISGCSEHPSLGEHEEIARLITPKIREFMNW